MNRVGFAFVLATAAVAGCSAATNKQGANGSAPSQDPVGVSVAPPASANAPPGAASPTQASGSLPGAPGAPATTGSNPNGLPGAAGAPGNSVAGASAMGSGTQHASAGAGAPPAADPPGTMTLTMDPFQLAAGQEIYKCQNFDNPFGGKETAIGRLATDMSPGSHHLHVYHMTTSQSRTLEDCTIADFHPLMFGAAMPHAETTYPPGMAAKLAANTGVRIQVHYLNTTDKSLMVQATLKLTPVDASTVTKWVSELYFSRSGGLSVPPGMSTTTTSCSIPNTYGPVGLVGAGAHTHSRAVHFTAKTGSGQMLIDTTDWESPPVQYDTPIMMNPGDSISWTCTYNNPSQMTYTFGESAQNNEMCIFLARFYSAPDGAQIECQAQGNTGYTMIRKN